MSWPKACPPSIWRPRRRRWPPPEGGAVVQRFGVVLARGAAETDPAALRAVYTEAQRMLLGDYAAIVPIYHPDRYFLRRPWLAGLGFSPFNFLSFRTMRVAP